MSLFEKIKSMFQDQPGEAEQAIKDSRSTREMLENLDELITRNEVELHKAHQELGRLEASEGLGIEKVRTGRVGEREKDMVLMQVRRTRSQMENLKLRADILNKNIELHLNLVGKIRAMEAMDLRGIEQSMVERLMLDFEEGMDAFREAVQTGEGAVRSEKDVLTPADKEELRKLEEEIMGEKTLTPGSQESEDALNEIKQALEEQEGGGKEKEEPEAE